MSAPSITNAGAIALLFSLILSLDKRKVISRSQFVEDLDDVIGMTGQASFLSDQVGTELVEIRNWLANRGHSVN